MKTKTGSSQCVGYGFRKEIFSLFQSPRVSLSSSCTRAANPRKSIYDCKFKLNNETEIALVGHKIAIDSSRDFDNFNFISCQPNAATEVDKIIVETKGLGESICAFKVDLEPFGEALLSLKINGDEHEPHLIFFSSLIFSFAFAQNRPISASHAKDSENFKTQKSLALATNGCVKNGDESCRRIENATSVNGLINAIGQKRESDRKMLTDRISVLECCLGIDINNTCVGLSKHSSQDVHSCKATLASSKEGK